MINLHEPSLDIQDEEFVLEALRSSWVSTSGPFVNRFEQDFAKFVNSRYAISTVNGTAALQLCLEVLKLELNIKDKFEVLTPSLTFIGTTNAIVHSGGIPVFVDSSSSSFNICVDKLEQIISKQYKANAGKLVNKDTGHVLLAIMPVHVMGWQADMERLSEISSLFNIPIVEDAAEAFGTFNPKDKQHVGLTGIASAFSFNGNKILTTGGGGMVVTNNEKFATMAKHLSTTAKKDNLRYEHDEAGFNFRLVNLLAALGCSQLLKMPAYLERKKEIFNYYSNHLNNDEHKIYFERDCDSNNWIVNIIFNSIENREKILMRLIEKKIFARPLWMPCHMQKPYQPYNNYLEINDSYKNTIQWWKTTLSLPSSPHLSNDNIQFIVDTILK